MGTNPDRSFASVLVQSKEFKTKFSLFPTYVAPNEDLTPEAIGTLITSMEEKFDAVADQEENEKSARDDRHDLFFEGDDSLMEILPFIGSSVKSHYGKDSSETELTMGLINDLRGGKPVNAGTNSTSERSYASMAGHFTELISTLDSFDPAYAPANTNITIAALTTRNTALQTAMTNVATEETKTRLLKDQRNEVF
jgi:hypothetical protein